MSVHNIADGRFVCTAEPTAACRNYPGCECEHWSRDLHGGTPAPGHEPVPQDECWIWQWLTSTDLMDTYIDEDGDDAPYSSIFPDGPVDYEWECDYMTWHYADDTQPSQDDEDDQ